LNHINHALNGPSLHSNIAQTLAYTLDTLGVKSQEILLASNLQHAGASQATDRVPAHSLQSLWRNAVQISQSDDLGIRFAQHLYPASLHGLGVCCATNETLLSALGCLEKYFRVISTFSQISLYQNFRAYFRCPITFGAQRNEIIFDLQTLHLPLPAANPAIASANEQAIIQYLRHFDDDDFGNRVKSLIVDTLSLGIPTQKYVAESINLSTRTLKRKLAQKGTSYAELLEQTQCELAVQYLSNLSRSIGEISNLIGYSEPSNFTRSFKKWTKLTPKEYRQRYFG